MVVVAAAAALAVVVVVEVTETRGGGGSYRAGDAALEVGHVVDGGHILVVDPQHHVPLQGEHTHTHGDAARGKGGGRECSGRSGVHLGWG